MAHRSCTSDPDTGTARLLNAWVVLVVGIACGPVHAFCEAGGPPRNALRLQAHEPSYLVARRSDGDENALQMHYSLRYMLDPDFEDEDAFYLKYNGAFDFYMGTRPSSPVINRLVISSPATERQATDSQATGGLA